MAFTNIVANDDGGKVLQFDLVGEDVAVANALRRTILADVRTVAVAYDSAKGAPTDICFLKNTSSLHNEFLSRRVALLPFHMTREQIEGYQHGDLRFRLKVKNTGAEMLDVTTHDVELVHCNVGGVESIRDVFPTAVLITRLKPNPLDPTRGEEIELTFGARHGTAKQHARWSPVSLCTYRNRLDQARVEQAREELQAAEGNNNKNKFETLDKWRLFEVNEHGEPCAFTFQIESECGLSPAEIVDMALDVLIARVRSLQDSGKFDVDVDDATGVHVAIIHKEDHTLGNLLQAFMYNTYVRQQSSTQTQLTMQTQAQATQEPCQKLQFVGYYQPHPLLDDIVVKMKPTPTASAETSASFDAAGLVRDAAAALEAHLKRLQQQWQYEVLQRTTA